MHKRYKDSCGKAVKWRQTPSGIRQANRRAVLQRSLMYTAAVRGIAEVRAIQVTQCDPVLKASAIAKSIIATSQDVLMQKKYADSLF